MPSYIALAIGGLLAAWTISCYRSFRTNLAAAKQSNLPYIVAPVYTFNGFWLVTHRLWLPFISRLPRSWTHPWIEYTTPDFAWKQSYRGFKERGSDAFLIVSPGKNMMLVADPEAINQITTRRNDFPKPTEIYQSVDLYGKNVVSTDGQLWRHHRKITSPPFTERNNVLVWQESLHQAQSMMTHLCGGKDSSGRLENVAAIAMTLALYVISKAGFGVRLQWPHEETNVKIAPGHKLTYKEALETLLLNVITVMLTPKWLLRNSPLKIHKIANQAFVEWGMYMRELYDAKRAQVKSGDGDPADGGLDLMGALVKGAGITAESLNSEEKNSASNGQLLSDDEILGNAFVFILAGHETAANTVHFAILYLAMHMSSQRRLQEELDAIVGDKPISEWDYDVEMPKLFGSMCGAVMNEVLRLIPPVVGIPKCTPKGQPQGLNINGQHVTVPGGCFVEIEASAVHRNDKYWPGGDLDEFMPERWSLNSSKQNGHANEDVYGEAGLEFDGPDKRADTAASLFRPQKGQYVPFSEGFRSCLGRRFAQVEILAVLAVIFREWTVELDVGAYMSDEEFANASEEAKRAAWGKADAKARDLLKNGMMTIITIQMRGEKVPFRFVRRGTERFDFMRD